MLFGKPKQDKRLSPETIRILLIIFLINFLYIGYWGGDDAERKQPMICYGGPLLVVSDCVEKRSGAANNAKWRYSDASGDVSGETCRKMTREEDELEVPVYPESTIDRIKRISCSGIGLLDSRNFCYAAQKLSDDGSTRYITILTTDANCRDARYFTGSNATLFEGSIKTSLTPGGAVEAIPELPR